MNLLDYIRGDRRGRAANRLERQAMADPLLADALEGYDEVEGSHDAAIARLRVRLHARLHARLRTRLAARGRERSRRRLRWVWLPAAALLVLFLGVGLLFRWMWTRPIPAPPHALLVAEAEMTAPADTAAATGPFAPLAPAAGSDTLQRQIEQASVPEPQEVQAVADIISVVSNDQRIETTLSFSEIDSDSGFIFQPATSNLPEEPLEEDTVTMSELSPGRTAAAGNIQEEIVEDDVPSLLVSEMPKFQGDKDLTGFRDWVQQRLVGHYPVVAQENGVQGRVTVQFVIERDGSLTNVVVMSSPDRSLAEAAVRVIESSPKWIPGRDRGRPVRVRFTLPVDFRLQ
jgi:protein TonB